MGIRITGTDQGADTRFFDSESGEDITSRLGATQARLVIPNGGQPARLEYDQHLTFDYTVTGATKAFCRCPVTGDLREIKAIDFADGGRLTFPRDFSSSGNLEQFREALPQGTAALAEEV